MCYKADYVLTAFILVLVWARTFATSSRKGSDSISSSDEESSKEKNEEKLTGHQHKFWVPTYHGNNPLNRKKIGITSSEIEKYDKSIDESLSGVGKKKNASDHKNTYDLPSIPFLWSGDEISSNINKSISFIDSEGISLENSLEGKLTEIKKSRIRSKNISQNKTAKREKSKKKALISEISNPTRSPHNRLINKTKSVNDDSLKEEKVSQLFFDELNKVQQNETERDSNYYKNLVKTATKNTKQKLGYKKPIKPPSKLKLEGPEIFAIDLDSKHSKSSIKQDKIGFSTRHEQAGGMDKEFDPKFKALNGHGSKKLKSSSKPKVGSKTGINFTTDLLTQHNTTGARIERHYKTINNTSKVSLENMKAYPSENKDESLSEFYDYSSLSDVHYKNKTQKKGKKKKSESGNSELLESAEEDRSIPKWSKKGLKTKADKLRTMQGKVTRQEKKQKAVKKRYSKKFNKEFDDRRFDYSDKENKMPRMRTTGEKRHAINSVRNYLQEGRPGKSKRGRQSNRYEERKDNWNRNDRDYSRNDRGDDYGERGGRWRPSEDRYPRGEGRQTRGYRRGGGGRRSNREEYRDNGPSRDRSWSNRGGRYGGFRRENDQYNERSGKFGFNTGEGRYGNDRREYRGRQGRQGKTRERYSNYGSGRRSRGGRRGGGRRRRG